MWLTNLLLFLLLIALTMGHAHAQGAYNVDRDAKLFTAQAQTYTINNRIGALNLTFEYVVSGSPGSLVMTVTGCMRGGTCDTLDTYTGTASAVRKLTGLYDSYVVTVTTLSGGTSPTVQMNAFFTANSSPASANGTQAAQVQGPAANAATAVGNPVLIGGLDPSSNARDVAVTAQGIVANSHASPVGDGESLANNTGHSVAIDGTFRSNGVVPMLFNGTSIDRPFYCPNTSTFSVASTTTQIVPLSGSTKVRICSASLNPTTTTAGSVDLVYGTGASCGTGTTTLSGAFTLPASAVVNIPVPLTAQGPLITPSGQAVCVRTVTSTVAGFITWAQF